ncbi:MAG: YkgJ family cysteine cluster protein [Acidobacteriota bacterium]
MADERKVYGTSELDAPVTRAELERAVRFLNLSDLDLKENLLKLAAQVVALTDELTRRIDGVEPEPAEPHTPAPAPIGTVEASVNAAIPEIHMNILAADAALVTRVSIDTGDDKYTVEPATPPCEELFPICRARCCKLTFSLSTRDLDEGVIRWDYGQPYLIRQRASDGYCVHNDPDSGGCTVHAFRPRVCRTYDCRNDPRIWTDYDQRIPAPVIEGKPPEPKGQFDLMERARKRASAWAAEKVSMATMMADDVPHVGPPPHRRKS